MPLLIAGQTEGWKLNTRLTNATYMLAAPTDKIRFAGTLASDALSGFQDSTHLLTSSGVHLCSPTHLNNTKFLTSTTASVNGAGSTSLPFTTAQCPLLFTFFSLEEIAISSASFYVYAGSDVTPITGTFYAAEAGDASWTDVNGSGNALALNAHPTPAVDHDFYIATSFTTSGAQTGTMKVTATYV